VNDDQLTRMFVEGGNYGMTDEQKVDVANEKQTVFLGEEVMGWKYIGWNTDTMVLVFDVDGIRTMFDPRNCMDDAIRLLEKEEGWLLHDIGNGYACVLRYHTIKQCGDTPQRAICGASAKAHGWEGGV